MAAELQPDWHVCAVDVRREAESQVEVCGVIEYGDQVESKLGSGLCD